VCSRSHYRVLEPQRVTVVPNGEQQTLPNRKEPTVSGLKPPWRLGCSSPAPVRCNAIVGGPQVPPTIAAVSLKRRGLLR
jgi:hypothetical protein